MEKQKKIKVYEAKFIEDENGSWEDFVDLIERARSLRKFPEKITIYHGQKVLSITADITKVVYNNSQFVDFKGRGMTQVRLNQHYFGAFSVNRRDNEIKVVYDNKLTYFLDFYSLDGIV